MGKSALLFLVVYETSLSSSFSLSLSLSLSLCHGRVTVKHGRSCRTFSTLQHHSPGGSSATVTCSYIVGWQRWTLWQFGTRIENKVPCGSAPTSGGVPGCILAVYKGTRRIQRGPALAVAPVAPQYCQFYFSFSCVLLRSVGLYQCI